VLRISALACTMSLRAVEIVVAVDRRSSCESIVRKSVSATSRS